MNSTPAPQHSPGRRVAIHEAGHAVMAYLLGRPFTSISIEADDESLGRVCHRLPGSWFRPDIEITARARNMIEDRVMILLAGTETERAWTQRQPDAPEGWEQDADDGAEHDLHAAMDVASYVSDGDVPELEAYFEWLRQRVLGYTGRGAGFDVAAITPDPPAFLVRHYREGNDRFWVLVTALADAVQTAGSLSWPRSRDVLRDADPMFGPRDR